MTPAAQPWRSAEGCVIVRVRLTPKSSLDAVEAITETADGPAIAARVRALPEDGAANNAVLRLVANWLGVPRRSVRLTSGAKSRVKSLTVEGNPRLLEERLAGRLRQLQD